MTEKLNPPKGSIVHVRHGCRDDLAAINKLYNQFILTTPITFDIVPIHMDVRSDWFSRFSPEGPHQLIIAELGGVFCGYAASMQFRKKAAYATSVETTIYVDPRNQGQGVGKVLYSHLFEQLETEDVHRAYAGITWPNEASVALHESFGFVQIGLYQEVGRKFGQYWDVAWYQKAQR